MLKKTKKIIFKLIFFVPDYIIDIWLFEAMSWIGRATTGRMKLKKNEVNFINLGSGDYYTPGFINIDFFFAPKIDYAADLRFPLKIESDTVNGIISEHTFEHLTYKQCDFLLKECYRIMKTSATIRIIVPDISIFIHNYSSNNSDWFKKWEHLMMIGSKNPERAKRRIATPMEALSFVTQEYGHVACWDTATMKYYLEKNGFKDVKQVSFRQGNDPKLNIDRDEESRKYVSLYIEAIK